MFKYVFAQSIISFFKKLLVLTASIIGVKLNNKITKRNTTLQKKSIENIISNNQ